MQRRSSRPKPSQNVTISLPADLLSDAKHLAVDEGLPLSHFIAGLVRARVAGSRRYQQAMREELRRMKQGAGFQLGTVTWTREDLHRR